MTQRTVLITGAGIGIGRATAIAFARGGDHVVVTDVLETEGRAVAAEIERTGGSAEFHALDVTETTGVDAVIAAVEAKRGAIDVVIANAGIAHRVPLAELTDVPREAWRQEVADMRQYLQGFGARLPAKLVSEIDDIERRFG